MFLYSLLSEMVKYPLFSLEVCFTMSQGYVAKLINDLKIRTYCLNMKSGFDFVNGIKLKELLREKRYDIVHSHTTRLLDCFAINLASPSAVIMTEHGDVMTAATVRKKVQRYLVSTMFRSYRYLVAVSDCIKKVMIKNYRLLDSKVLVIKNGVDLKRFSNLTVRAEEVRKKLKLPLHGRIIGTVGRLSSVKGVDQLISAAPIILKKYPDCLFLIVGDGPLHEELESKVESTHLSRSFKFLGEQHNIPELLSIMDVLVFPSVMEGFPIAVIEGMVMGKPIVAYNVGGMPEAIIHGETGLLTKQRDPVLLAQHILTLLDNEDFCHSLGTAARELACKQFCIRKVTQEYVELYLHVLEHNTVGLQYKNEMQGRSNAPKTGLIFAKTG